MNFLSKFSGKSVVITGHTGFKGSWLTTWLNLLGAKITGIALDPIPGYSHFNSAALANLISDNRVDIRNRENLQSIIHSVQPDFVFHLAAQSLVKTAYDDPIQTWETNVLGTINVLESLRILKKSCSAVIITSDKCYENVEWCWGYREIDPLGGSDPYSASKAAAELAISSYIKSYFPKNTSKVRISSARAGNVIGGGDWSSNRIIPDCIKSWSINQPVELRNPHSTRPWQHVLEPLSGYLTLAIALSQNETLHGEPFNFGPRSAMNYSVLDLVREMSLYWNQVSWIDNVIGHEKQYESGLLKLSCDKALLKLNWHATMGFKDTVRMTAEWYKSFYNSPFDSNKTLKSTIDQISEYMVLAKNNGANWAL